MKLSRYHLLFSRSGEYFLYNTKTLALSTISEEAYSVLKEVENDKISLSKIDSNLLKFLQNGKFVCTTGNSDDDFCNKLEYRKRFESFVNRTLSLVIAPTLACNFACPYCYEKDLPASIMSKETENEIIRFIDRYKDVCTGLELCWDGGEPLLGFSSIKSIVEKIKTQSSLKIRTQSIVTNGYLLSPEICQFFAKEGLNLAQITIDGTPNSHNKTRILKTGEPTYEHIIHNIDMLSEMAPQCRIIVRTNIHNGNKHEFIETYNILSERWAGRNLIFYPTFVVQNEYCRVSCCSPREKSEFNKTLIELGIRQNELMPKIDAGGCAATKENSYIISPSGELYKCWNDIGIRKYCIGNLSDGVKNNDLIAKYILGSDKFKDNKCRNCNLFPICDGGCNKNRIKNIENGTNYSLCPFDEIGIEDSLYNYYKKAAHHTDR